MSAFAEGLCSLMGELFPPIQEVALCLRNRADVEALADLVPALSLIHSHEQSE
jgi:hypothetical protein